MRILLIRHGDPNYDIDGLTEKGQKEAALLVERLKKEPIDAFYCSILGRARRTLEPTLEFKKADATYCDWLQEFHSPGLPYTCQRKLNVCWDVLPRHMQEHPALYTPDWQEVEFIRDSEIPARYQDTCNALDALLAEYGYRRQGVNYVAEQPCDKTIALVCHFGVACVLLSHLMQCSPYTFWQHAFLPPTSVTTFYTEEREQGIAAFRAAGIGDISHLYCGNEPASFSGRYCEQFTDETRH